MFGSYVFLRLRHRAEVGKWSSEVICSDICCEGWALGANWRLLWSSGNANLEYFIGEVVDVE